MQLSYGTSRIKIRIIFDDNFDNKYLCSLFLGSKLSTKSSSTNTENFFSNTEHSDLRGAKTDVKKFLSLKYGSFNTSTSKYHIGVSNLLAYKYKLSCSVEGLK